MEAAERIQPRRSAAGSKTLKITALGLAVGLACWPLNAIDRIQDQWIHRLPGFSGGPWSPTATMLALAPLLVLPIILLLQASVLRSCAGSGLPQLIEALEQPSHRPRLLAAAPSLGRIGLWSVASLALMPLGREGPAAQLGAAVAHALGRGRLGTDLLAASAGAALAGAFNTPLMGVVFVAEELTRSFQAALIWPALLMAGAAALVSSLGGQPLFALGIHAEPVAEWQQVAWAVPIGLGAGLLGGLLARLLLLAGGWLLPLARTRPLATGLVLGAALSLLTFISGGRSCGDGETLLHQLLDGTASGQPGASVLAGLGWPSLLVERLVGPVLGLASGVAGGLIDPALALGGSFGAGVMHHTGGAPYLGICLGMASALAGCTQLPVMSLAFAIRMAGAQSLLPGLLIASVVGAMVGRLIQPEPIYRALASRAGDPTPTEIPAKTIDKN
jgi:H+/Cl- antiporter ClcA